MDSQQLLSPSAKYALNLCVLIVKDVAEFLDNIIPPVLGCFSDQDSRLRYYALESMYNIAKVAKGEILPYFNQVFDALCKVGL